MKRTRFTAALLAAASTFAMWQAIPASAEELAPLMGDLDGDQKVTAVDAQAALSLYAESLVENETNEADAENNSADIDMDGEIDVLDAQKILLYYCQTLVGEQPLWAEFRTVSYRDARGKTITDDAERPFALRDMYLEIGCAEGAPGELVDVPVYIAGVDELAGFQLFIKSDEALTLDSIVPDFYYENEVSKPEFNPASGAIVWAQAQNFDPRDGQVLGSFKYQIPEDAEEGAVYRVCLNDEENNIFITKDFKAYEFTLLEGVVRVAS